LQCTLLSAGRFSHPRGPQKGIAADRRQLGTSCKKHGSDIKDRGVALCAVLHTPAIYPKWSTKAFSPQLGRRLAHFLLITPCSASREDKSSPDPPPPPLMSKGDGFSGPEADWRLSTLFVPESIGAPSRMAWQEAQSSPPSRRTTHRVPEAATRAVQSSGHNGQREIPLPWLVNFNFPVDPLGLLRAP